MTSMRTVTRFVMAASLVAAGFIATAEGSTISVQPSTQTIAPGTTTSVDLVLSGLTANEVIGAFSVVVSYNNAILDGVSFVNDPGQKMGSKALACNGGFGPGPCDASLGFTGANDSPLDLFYNADLVSTSAQLKALQDGGFVLATVSLRGTTEGLSPVTLGFQPLNGTFLSDFNGNPISLTSITVQNGSICVDDPATPGNRCAQVTAVPEPATLSLLGAGLVAAVARRRRKASKA